MQVITSILEKNKREDNSLRKIKRRGVSTSGEGKKQGS